MKLLECGNPKFMGRAHFPRANSNLEAVIDSIGRLKEFRNPASTFGCAKALHPYE